MQWIILPKWRELRKMFVFFIVHECRDLENQKRDIKSIIASTIAESHFEYATINIISSPQSSTHISSMCIYWKCKVHLIPCQTNIACHFRSSRTRITHILHSFTHTHRWKSKSEWNCTTLIKLYCNALRAIAKYRLVLYEENEIPLSFVQH